LNEIDSRTKVESRCGFGNFLEEKRNFQRGNEEEANVLT